jgi:hypothetical protein
VSTIVSPHASPGAAALAARNTESTGMSLSIPHRS